MATVDETVETVESAPTPRFGTDIDQLKKDTKGAIKAAVDALGLAASLTQNVPYLGAVSSALAMFIKIQDEVDAVRDEWESVTADAGKIKTVVDQTKSECEKRVAGDKKLPGDFIEALKELEKCILTTLKTLAAYRIGSKRKRDRIRVVVNRAALAGDVKKCGKDMSAALELFNIKVNIGTRLDMHELVTKHTALFSIPAVILSSTKPPPPAPDVFYGRAQEIDHVLDLVLHQAPVRVAVLGPGGIGKTSIALKVLHHPDVVATYAERRFFVSCETVTSTEGVVLELLTTFGLALDPMQGIQPQQALLKYLQGLSDGILCLDNLETIWDTETRATEMLLSSLASFRQLALIVTTRGTRRPMHVAWSHPFLPPITPLSFDAAVQTWEDLCEVHDEFSVKLIQGVDCVPLAVSLLANLAADESPQTLWKRWEYENLQVLHTHNATDRLSNIEYSIELSLRGPRLRDEIDTLRVLGILCLLPQGLLETRMSVFRDAYTVVLPTFIQSVSLLRQCSLVYLSENGYLRVLSPISHYVDTRYPLVDHYLRPLAEIYYRLVDHESPGGGAMYSPYAEENIRPEIGNISAILLYCLNCQFDGHRYRALAAIVSFSKHCQNMSFYDIRLLNSAYDLAQQYPRLAIDLLGAMGLLYYYSSQYTKAIAVYSQASRLGHDIQDGWEEAWCLFKLGDTYLFHGELDLARCSLQSALSIHVHEDYPISLDLFQIKMRLAEVYVRLGRLQAAQALLQAIAIDQVSFEGDGWLITKTIYFQTLGEAYLAQNKFDRAEQELAYALKLSDTFCSFLDRANILSSLGILYTSLGRYDEAERALHTAEELYESIGDNIGKAVCFGELGRMHLRRGDLKPAEGSLRSATQLLEQFESPLPTVRALNALGDLLCLTGRCDEAHEQLGSAIELSSRMSYPLGHGEALFGLGRVHRERDGLQEALDCFRQAIKKFEQAEDPHKANSVRLEMEELMARLRATGAYISPATTEGSMHSARSHISSEGDDGEVADDGRSSSEDSEEDGEGFDEDDSKERYPIVDSELVRSEHGADIGEQGNL